MRVLAESLKMVKRKNQNLIFDPPSDLGVIIVIKIQEFGLSIAQLKRTKSPIVRNSLYRIRKRGVKFSTMFSIKILRKCYG